MVAGVSGAMNPPRTGFAAKSPGEAAFTQKKKDRLPESEQTVESARSYEAGAKPPPASQALPPRFTGVPGSSAPSALHSRA